MLLPEGADERAIALAAYERGALVEDAAWYWARPQEAPSLVLGYGSLSEPLIRRGIAIVAEAVAATAR